MTDKEKQFMEWLEKEVISNYESGMKDYCEYSYAKSREADIVLKKFKQIFEVK